MWDLKQRNFFCVRLRPHSLWTQAGKRSTLGCGCRDSLYTGLGAALLSLPMSLSSGSRHRGGERVTYLDLLNSFHQWQKSNYLPGNARLLYYGLLAVFNEARWPEQVQIDNFRLMSMLDMKRFVKCFFELLTQIIVKVRKCKVQRVCVLHFQLAGSGGCFLLMKLYH